MPDRDGFAVVEDVKIKRRRTPEDREMLKRNLDKTRQNPGKWCIVGSYPTISIASDVRRECKRDHPDLEFASRTIDGEGKVLAYYEPKVKAKAKAKSAAAS